MCLAARLQTSPVLHSAWCLPSPPTSQDENAEQGFFIGCSMKEIWKPIPGYEGRYEINIYGEVWSRTTHSYLKPNRMKHGYLCVHLYSGGRHTRKVHTIHQLVAKAFLRNPKSYTEVNHKNFDRADNCVENLEWVSRKENVQHALAAGRRVKPQKKVKGITLKSGHIYTFNSLIEAEIALRGKQTGGISHALKNNRPAYGCVWWLA